MFFKDPPRLILASTSAYRRALLERLKLPFDSVPPDVDETRLAHEPVESLVVRLARAKADAVAVRFSDAIVIGSDQAAARGDEILGKPLTVERCVRQLHESSGHDVVFFTAVHIVDGRAGRREQHVDRTVARFRQLTGDEIARYVERDQPLDCAGGFKAESLGIALFERVETSDPPALTGLPLAWVAAALRRAGLPAP